MVRNLYRFYLYFVYIALLIFVTVTIGRLLYTLLLFTPWRGYQPVPDHTQLTQDIVFAVVALVIGGGLAALHYWLIRRDMHSDPAAGTSAIRSFFLNITEFVGITIAVPTFGFGVLLPLAEGWQYSVAWAAAVAIPALALVVLLEFERRRTLVTGGVARAFQRFHFYGAQIFMLMYLSFAWFYSFRLFLSRIATKVGVHLNCPDYYSNCFNSHSSLLALTLLWFIAAWIFYGWLLRKDNATTLRLILLGVQFAYGVGLVLDGLSYGVKLLLLPLFHIPYTINDIIGYGYPQYDFVSPLVLGLIVVGVYAFWLRDAALRGFFNRVTLFLTENAIAAVLAAGAFWLGCGNLLYNTFQKITPIPEAPDKLAWITAISLVVVGVGYIGFDLYLHRREVRDAEHAAGPRRGFVFALLGAGILAFAIGGATALYTWVTASFGSPIYNWQQAMHAGLATFIVGTFLVAIYLWAARREQLFNGLGKRPDVPPTPVEPVEPTAPLEPDTIEAVLDALLAGKMTRDEAARRIHTLQEVTAHAQG